MGTFPSRPHRRAGERALGRCWHLLGRPGAGGSNLEADDAVVVEFVGRGTQSAEFGPRPFPNKGGSFELRAIQVYSLNSAGQISNVNLYYDTMTMLSQLGHMG